MITDLSNYIESATQASRFYADDHTLLNMRSLERFKMNDQDRIDLVYSLFNYSLN
jgi:hypothetical protein